VGDEKKQTSEEPRENQIKERELSEVRRVGKVRGVRDGRWGKGKV